jgi:putative dimethyl sulfoxide reductase chaperone
MDSNNQENNILKGYNMLLYFAGSMIMYEPHEECITDFWTKGILKNLPVSSSNPNFIKAASQLRNSCSDLSNCIKSLRDDYIRLLGSKELPLAPVYESYYHDNGYTHVNQILFNVSDFYNSYGWKSHFRSKIQDDHLGIELLFLTILVEKYLVLEDEACRIEMKKEIRRYIDTHLLSWISYWNERIQAQAVTLCYKGIGSLILSCVEDIDSFFEQSLSSLSHNDILKN